MKLNVDILKDNLSDIIPVKQYGHGHIKLSLTRPLLYDGKSSFKSDNVYITSFDNLPKQPNLEDRTVIICIGKELPKPYYSNKCVLLLLDTTKNIYSVFNIVQKTFDKYDKWDAKLQQITMERGTLSSLLDTSLCVLENPMFILDKNLEVIANSTIFDEVFDLDDELDFRSDDSFIKSSLIQVTSKKKDVYIYNKLEYNIMCINLFKKGKYVGGLYMKANLIRPFRTSDQGLLLHLKTYVDFLLNQYQEILSVDNNIMKDIFTKVLNGDILKDTRLLKEIRINRNSQDKYICIKFKLEESSKVIPTKLICEQIEDILPGTVAMVYQNVIVAFMNYSLSNNTLKPKGTILINFLQAMGYRAGLSEEFADVLQARYYFIEACAAIDIGYDLNPDLEVYYFEDYIKEYLLSMITSEIPTEIICEKGLLRLLEYDKVHKTTYYNELRVYLDCNMNAVQAAKKLYIHRNTLLIHLEHIIRISSIKLEDPEERMYVQLSYKLLEKEGIYEYY